MTRFPLRGGALLAAAAIGLACASNPPPAATPGAPAPAERFDSALSARASGDPGTAAARLRTVLDRCAGEPLGDQAFLLLAATGLDPRFREGPPESVAAETARFLARGSTSLWAEAVAESLHLVARDLGDVSEPGGEAAASGSPAPTADCEARWVPADSAAAAPALGRPSLRARIRALELTADSLRAEVKRLRELLKTPRP